MDVDSDESKDAINPNSLKDMSNQATYRLINKKKEQQGCMEYSIWVLMDECNSRNQCLLVLLQKAFTNIEEDEQLAQDTIRGIQNTNSDEDQRNPFWRPKNGDEDQRNPFWRPIRPIKDIQDEGEYVQEILKQMLENTTNNDMERHQLRLLQPEFQDRITWVEQLTEYLNTIQ